MRDQVLVQRVGNRSGIGSRNNSASGQRPQRRERESHVSVAERLRAVVRYVPTALKVALFVTIGVFVFLGYRAAASASFFQVRQVDTQGLSRASMDAIQTTVRRDVGKTGVWQADLNEISVHLQQLPWVRTAVVSRVLPDRIRVRITEREPRAVVRMSSGRFMWVDDDGVVLAEMKPSDQMPTFLLRGWNEDSSAGSQAENRERIQKFVELQRTWDSLGLSERVSEVNLMDLSDVRAQLSGDDSQIEVRLGSQDLGKRLQKALDALDKLKQTPKGPYVSYLDLNQGRRVIVGLTSGSHAVADDDNADVHNESVAANTKKKRQPRNEKELGANNQRKTEAKRR